MLRQAVTVPAGLRRSSATALSARGSVRAQVATSTLPGVRLDSKLFSELPVLRLAGEIPTAAKVCALAAAVFVLGAAPSTGALNVADAQANINMLHAIGTKAWTFVLEKTSIKFAAVIGLVAVMVSAIAPAAAPAATVQTRSIITPAASRVLQMQYIDRAGRKQVATVKELPGGDTLYCF